MSNYWNGFIDNEADKTNLLIIDGLNLAFRLTASQSMPSDFVRHIQSFAKTYKAKDVLVLSDKGVSKFRANILPEYKQNRVDAREKMDEKELANRKLFFQYFNEALDLSAKTFKTFYFKDIEADDLAAVAVGELKDNYEHVWLISTDGDWDTLLSDNVSRFSYRTRKEYTLDNFYDEHSCENPEEFVSLKAIMGDLGDNIRGVEGVGLKRGYGLIREYGSALDIIDSIPLEGKQAFIKNLNNSEDIILRNLQLVDLPSFGYEAVKAGSEEFFEYYITELGKLKND